MRGTGRTIAQATYAPYSGRYTERAFGRNTNVGTPSLVSLAYIGPNGTGMNFAPGFNLANYAVIGGNFPTANVFFDEGLSSPKTNEFTLSLGRELPNAGHAKVSTPGGTTNGFIEDFIDDPTAAGKVTVPQTGGILDRVIWQNTDEPKREYQALQFMARVRIIDRLVGDGHWTVQIKNHGNFEGEAANQPGNASIWFDYPELFNEARYYPYGPLDEFQRHKVRLWTTLQPGPRAFRQPRHLAPLAHQFGTDLQPLHGQCRAVAGTDCAQSRAMCEPPAPARPQRSSSASVAARTSTDTAVVDLAIRYSIPVWKSLRPWVQLQIYNVFNNQKLIQWDTTVTPDPNSPLDELGQRTGYIKGANFGTGTAATHYPRWSSGENGGRTFRIAFGVRF